MTDFDEQAKIVHDNSVTKGFYDGYNLWEFKDAAAKLCLIHSEVTEVMEAIRKEKGQREVLDEIADILIRTLDFYQGLVDAGYVTGSLDIAYDNKVRVNSTRPHMHGVLG